MTAKSHFEKSQAHYTAISAHHAKLAKLCRDEGRDDEADAHDGLAKAHAAHADHCRKMADDVAHKAVVDDLEKTRRALPDTNIHGAIPAPPGVTLVPRNGQRPIAAANVESGLAKVLGLDDLDQISQEPSLAGR